MSPRRAPPQRPYQNDGVFVTPDPFIAAVKHRLGISDFVVDLAASASNTKALRFLDEAHDSLAFDWSIYAGRRWCWLNPPFTNIEPWVKKCDDTGYGVNIALLVPASVGSDWWRSYVDGRAYVLFPGPRLSFDGRGPYPKDVALALYGMSPGYECWEWKKDI